MATTKCPYCAEEIQAEALKCKHCGSWLSGPPEESEPDPLFTIPALSRRLLRSSQDRMLAGVCGGFARYLGIDPTVVRVLFALGTFFSLGSGIIVYIIMAFVIPSDDTAIV